MSPAVAFGARLRTAVNQRGPLCVGIDPHPFLLRAWGLDDDVAGLKRFSRTVVDALAGEVAVLKPQSAFFERHGSRGVAVLEEVIASSREAGALVLTDVKRGDIGSTAQAYADAYLDPSSALCSDAITVSPYLGFGSLRPLIDTALEHGNGVFVLALTSNPEGPRIQGARTGDGRTVAGTILDEVRSINRETADAEAAEPGGSGRGVGEQAMRDRGDAQGQGDAQGRGDARDRGEGRSWGNVGCVVGATIGSTAENLDIGGPLLTPGVGAQGATAADLRTVFGSALTSVLPSVSREILRAGPEAEALRKAASTNIEAVRDVLFQASKGS